MTEPPSGSCLLFQIANLIAAGLICIGIVVSAYTTWVPLHLRSKFWLVVVAGLIVIALVSKDVANLIGQLGTVFVAMLAIWNDKLIDFFNPPACAITRPIQDPTIQNPGRVLRLLSGLRAEDAYHQYHIEVQNLNSSRPLKAARVSFRRYEVDGKKCCVAVPRQFTWAPHESEPRDAFVPRTKVLDLCYLDLMGKNLSLIIYSGKGGFDGGEEQFNHMSGNVIVLHLEISADNISHPIGQRLTIDMQDITPCFHIEPEQVE